MTTARGGRTATCWYLSWVSLFTVLTLQAFDAWFYQMPAIIWFGKLFPLLLFLPGMYRDKLRSFIWVCFVSLLYFIAQVERVFAQPDDTLAYVGLVAVVVLFTSAMLYVRWRARDVRAAEG